MYSPTSSARASRPPPSLCSHALEVILEIREGTSGRNLRAWDILGSVPAVRNGRIYLITGDELVTPGPASPGPSAAWQKRSIPTHLNRV